MACSSSRATGSGRSNGGSTRHATVVARVSWRPVHSPCAAQNRPSRHRPHRTSIRGLSNPSDATDKFTVRCTAALSQYSHRGRYQTRSRIRAVAACPSNGGRVAGEIVPFAGIVAIAWMPSEGNTECLKLGASRWLAGSLWWYAWLSKLCSRRWCFVWHGPCGSHTAQHGPQRLSFPGAGLFPRRDRPQQAPDHSLEGSGVL